MEQWRQEINEKTTVGALTVYVHHGQKRSKDPNHMQKFDVVLTSFGTMYSEIKGELGDKDKKKKRKRKRTNATTEEEEAPVVVGRKENRAEWDEKDDEKGIIFDGPLFIVPFWRVILDVGV